MTGWPCPFCDRKLGSSEGRTAHINRKHKERKNDAQHGKSIATKYGNKNIVSEWKKKRDKK